MTYPDDLPLAERRQIALQEMHRYGREDFLFDGRQADSYIYSESVWGVTLSEIQDAYTTGWQQAQQEEQRDGATLFYLHELLRRMQEDQSNWVEWYGTSFNEPITLVAKAIAGLNTKRKKREHD